MAVAAKDKSRAKAFADDFRIPTYYGSYEELGTDSNVGTFIIYNTLYLLLYIYLIHTLYAYNRTNTTQWRAELLLLKERRFLPTTQPLLLNKYTYISKPLELSLKKKKRNEKLI